MQILSDHPKKKAWLVRKLSYRHDNSVHYDSVEPNERINQSSLLIYDRKPFIFKAVLELDQVVECRHSSWVMLKDMEDNARLPMRIHHFNDLLNLAKQGKVECNGLRFVGDFTFNIVASTLHIEPYVT